MSRDPIIEPMREDFLLWRCLHHAPLSRRTIDRFPASGELPFERYRARNLPLLARLTEAYGAAAIVARRGGRIVGHLRFYPRAIMDMTGAGGLCLLQDSPSGPREAFAANDFPPLEKIADKTLVVHCLMAGPARGKDNPYLRRGLGSALVRHLIGWAAARGWRRIEADAFEDLPIIYAVTGSAGRSFWEKLGFELADRSPHPALLEPSEFVETLESQAKEAGFDPARARDRLLMRLELGRTMSS